MKNSILVIGGDLRLSYGAEALRKRGFFVEQCCGFKSGVCSREEIKRKTERADILLLPVPASNDGTTLNAPFCDESILLSDIALWAGEEKIILGGKIPDGIFGGAVHDYLKREDFAMLNAVPTAEGALEIAMRETESTVAGSRCLVVGYGKIGKMLCKMFSGVGAAVCATARKPQDIALINAYGFESAKTADIAGIIGDFDIIINTVPERVIGEGALLNVKKGALIIDTASKPGGLDIKKAQSLGINVLWALSLPGKVAPKTSGEIICNTACNILSETGV